MRCLPEKKVARLTNLPAVRTGVRFAGLAMEDVHPRTTPPATLRPGRPHAEQPGPRLRRPVEAARDVRGDRGATDLGAGAAGHRAVLGDLGRDLDPVHRRRRADPPAHRELGPERGRGPARHHHRSHQPHAVGDVPGPGDRLPADRGRGGGLRLLPGLPRDRQRAALRAEPRRHHAFVPAAGGGGAALDSTPAQPRLDVDRRADGRRRAGFEPRLPRRRGCLARDARVPPEPRLLQPVVDRPARHRLREDDAVCPGSRSRSRWSRCGGCGSSLGWAWRRRRR